MTVFVDGEGDQSETIQHESFGMVSFSRLSGGGGNLFGVDYDTGHCIRLEVKTGELHRDKYSDSFFERATIAQVDMSEVQFARLVASMNTSGVPCTIRHAATTGFKKMDPVPDYSNIDEKAMKEDVQKTARRVSANMDHLRKELDALTKPGVSLTKAKIAELAHIAQQTQQAVESDMPYLTARQEQRVDKAVHSGKAEIEAHMSYQLEQLGREALGQKLKKGGGVTIRIAGKPVGLLPSPETEGEDNAETG